MRRHHPTESGRQVKVRVERARSRLGAPGRKWLGVIPRQGKERRRSIGVNSGGTAQTRPEDELPGVLF